MTRYVNGRPAIQIFHRLLKVLSGISIKSLTGSKNTNSLEKTEEVNTTKTHLNGPSSVTNLDVPVISTSVVIAPSRLRITKPSGSYEMTMTSKSSVSGVMDSGKPATLNIGVSYDATIFMSREEWEGMTDGERLSYLADIPMNSYTIDVLGE